MLPKNILQNAQTIQLLAKIIQTEIIFKSYQNAKLEGLGFRDLKVWLKEVRSASTLGGYEELLWLKYRKFDKCVWILINRWPINCYQSSGFNSTK